MLMEGDPFLLIEGMAIAGLAVGATHGLRLHPLGISARLPHVPRRDREGAGGRLARAQTCSARATRSTSRRGSAPAPISAARRLRCSKASRASAGRCAPKPPLPALAGPVRQADRHQQCAELRLDAVDSRTWRQGLCRIRRRPLARLAAVPACGQRQARRPGRTRLRRDDPPARRRLRRRHALGAADPRRAGRRPARRLFPGKPARHAARLRGDARRPRACSATAASSSSTTASTWRKQARFAFEFCAKESCGKCTPCRIGSTRGVETVDKIIAGRDRARQHRAAARSLRDDDRRLALRARRPDAAAGAQRARPFPRGLSLAPLRASRRNRRRSMALLQELDTGTPIRVERRDGHAHHRRADDQRAEGHVGDGGGGAVAGADPETLRDRQPRGVRLLPALPRRDRGPQGHAGLLHDARRSGHGRAHADAAARQAAARRDGALHLRSSARLPDLQRQRRLRIADAGRRRRPARRALRLRRREPSRRRRPTPPIPISPSNPRNASSARAACAPARKCRARSR